MGKSQPSPGPQTPLRLAGAGKRGVRTQFGALCYRRQAGRVQVLLVTSRGRGHWTIPKGWPIKGATPAQSARREAREEAGAKGQALPVCLGIYSYLKRKPGGRALPCVVAVFPLRVDRLTQTFAEADTRQRHWFDPKDAAAAVHAPELAEILRRFDPDLFETATEAQTD